MAMAQADTKEVKEKLVAQLYDLIDMIKSNKLTMYRNEIEPVFDNYSRRTYTEDYSEIVAINHRIEFSIAVVAEKPK